jgi:hypothetical protein
MRMYYTHTHTHTHTHTDIYIYIYIYIYRERERERDEIRERHNTKLLSFVSFLSQLKITVMNNYITSSRITYLELNVAPVLV